MARKRVRKRVREIATREIAAREIAAREIAAREGLLRVLLIPAIRNQPRLPNSDVYMLSTKA
jgi:hypothetical protein